MAAYPETVEEAKAHPEVFTGKSIGHVADRFETIIRGLDRKPAVVGHSFGGLLTQILAGRGLAAVSVAIDPAQFQGRAAAADLFAEVGVSGARRPGQPHAGDAVDLRQVPPRVCQRRQRGRGEAAVGDHSVPTSGRPLFQAATANLNPWTEAKVDTDKSERGPLLIILGEKDSAIANASYKQQQDNQGVTEIVEIKNRGHALTPSTALARSRRHRPDLRQTIQITAQRADRSRR
jgi:non-heme chloroperoxidase